MNIRYSRTSSDQLEIQFEHSSEWERVRDVLIREWKAQEVDRLQTVDQIWIDLMIEGTVLTLHWDDMAGACLIASDKSADDLLRRIAKYLSKL